MPQESTVIRIAGRCRYVGFLFSRFKVYLRCVLSCIMSYWIFVFYFLIFFDFEEWFRSISLVMEASLFMFIEATPECEAITVLWFPNNCRWNLRAGNNVSRLKRIIHNLKFLRRSFRANNQNEYPPFRAQWSIIVVSFCLLFHFKPQIENPPKRIFICGGWIWNLCNDDPKPVRRNL